MSQLLVRNLSPTALERLKTRAKSRGRSLEAEARLILESVAQSEGVFVDLLLEGQRPAPDLSALRELARMALAKSRPQKTDSADLIREDRER